MNRVISRFASPYTYARPNPQGTTAAGGAAPMTWAAKAPFSASIQPLSGRELMILPEGERTRERIKIYSETVLQVADQVRGTKGDLVQYNNRNWEVQAMQRWDLNDFPFYKYLAQLTPEK